MYTRRQFLGVSAVAAWPLLAPSSADNSAPVTLTPEPTWLDDLIARVTRQGGEALGVESGCRWDGLMASAKHRPVQRVKADLAELFHYSWSDDRTKPIIAASARQRSLEQAYRIKMYGASANRMAEYCALLDEPPEAIERARQQRKLGYTTLDAFKTLAYRLAIGFWATLTPEQAEAVFASNSHRVYVPWREMTGEQRRLALALAHELENPSLGPQYPKVTATPHAVELMQAFGLVLLGWTWEFGRSSNVKYVEVHGTKPPIELAYDLDFRPAAPVGKANRGNPYELSPSDPHAERGYTDLERMSFPANRFRQNYPMSWTGTFSQLAERLPFALYSDYVPGRSVGVDTAGINPREQSGNPAVLPLEKMKVAEVLDALCSRLGQVWWRRGDAIFFRSRTWFIDRLFQPPRDVLAICRGPLTENGRLDLGAVDRLAQVTWQEMGGLDQLAQDEIRAWVPYSGLYHGLHRLLQVYAMLKTHDRDRALEDGVAADRLSLFQRRCYQEALFTQDAPYETLADLPPLRFGLRVINGIPKRRPNLAQLYYAPKADASIDDQPVTTCLSIPSPMKEREAML